MLKYLFQFNFFQTWADFVDRVWDSGGACENGGVVWVLDVRVVLAHRAAVRAADGEDATNTKTEKKSSFQKVVDPEKLKTRFVVLKWCIIRWIKFKIRFIEVLTQKHNFHKRFPLYWSIHWTCSKFRSMKNCRKENRNKKDHLIYITLQVQNIKKHCFS